MNKILVASAFVLAASVSVEAFAQMSNAGGFDGPAMPAVTVADALNMSDDSAVVLVGKIGQNLGNEKYLFKDASGEITVEIDNEDWRGLTVKPEDVIVIEGEVDKDMFKTEIDVNSVKMK